MKRLYARLALKARVDALYDAWRESCSRGLSRESLLLAVAYIAARGMV
jgi:hypothetical protein